MLKKIFGHFIILSIFIGQLAVFVHNFDSDHDHHHADEYNECEVCFYIAQFDYDYDFDLSITAKLINFISNDYCNFDFEDFNKFNAFLVRAPPFFF